ncbi:hypothetical protein BZG36_03013 [Bifiguratus adelaidae]|uniref:Uncharacterized protein n=1 Tax=Bifiguratus adelaidae TaxID=1938954 RepID=A0A261XZN9_9FUNG|nr:hypothetical protein BZG36_03013 [Bifiguratus adelaidae]
MSTPRLTSFRRFAVISGHPPFAAQSPLAAGQVRLLHRSSNRYFKCQSAVAQTPRAEPGIIATIQRDFKSIFPRRSSPLGHRRHRKGRALWAAVLQCRKWLNDPFSIQFRTPRLFQVVAATYQQFLRDIYHIYDRPSTVDMNYAMSAKSLFWNSRWNHRLKVPLAGPILDAMTPESLHTMIALPFATPKHLVFEYGDMRIHASRNSLLSIADTITSKGSTSAFILTNINILKADLDAICSSPSSQRIKRLPNAGGSSHKSEVLSYVFLERMLGCELLKTEMEIIYEPRGGPMVDYSIHLPQHLGSTWLAVSVTRAIAFGRNFTLQDAEKLIRHKLLGVFFSNQTIVQRQRPSRQILHIWAREGKVARILSKAWSRVMDDMPKSTIVIVSVVNMDAVFLNKAFKQ